MDLDQILVFRAKIARLGERDLFHWWDSEAGADTGQYVFRRLFPRTAPWVSIEMAIKCAQIRHAALLPPVPTVHLYNLGAELERRLENRLYELKMQNADVARFQVDLPIQARSSVSAALAAIGIHPMTGQVEERAIYVGHITRADLTDIGRLVPNLAAAYGYSRPGRLIVPYYHLVEDQ